MTYIVQRKSRFYVVAYDGLDTLTGRERRRWHPAGHSRTDAEAIAANLDLELASTDAPAGTDPLPVARYLTEQWLPVRRHDLDPSTAHRYGWMIDHYITPAVETDTGLAGMTFDPTDERLLVWVNSGSAVTFRTDTWQPDPDSVITPDDGGLQAAAFSATGDFVVTRNLAGTIEIRDPQTFDVVRVIAGGTNAAEAVTFGPYISSDGEYLLTVRDLTPRLWHLPTGTLLGTFPHDPGNTAEARSGQQQLRLATAVGDNALVWNLDFESWPEIACRAAGRNLTPDEWAQYGATRSDYQVTCSQWPSLA